MELTSSRTVPASVEATWAALNDPETLKACIPGCESIERVSDDEFRVTMTARVGPVAAKFSGRIVLADRVAPTSYRMTFEGQGGAAGFARGEARVALAPEGTNTRIDYSASAQVGGKLAQIGSRLVDGAAAKVAEDFFACFVLRVAASPAAAAPATVPVAAPQSAPAISRAMWVRLGLAVLIVVALVVYWTMRPA
jgi:carbon monoxide dehydrogenase subunit G